MATVQLGLDTLFKFDPSIVVQFSQHLREVTKDCFDMPGDDANRTVILKCRVSPILEANGMAELVDLDWQVQRAVPIRKSQTRGLRMTRGGLLLFNENNPDDIEQSHIDDLETDGSGRVRRDGRVAAAGD